MSVETTPQTRTRCPLCGGELNASGDECTRCDWVEGYGEQDVPDLHPRDIAAAILSIVPGAGHVFKGHQVGWVFLALIPVVLVMAFTFTMFFGWLMVPVYWLAVAVDAYLRKDMRHLPIAPKPLDEVNDSRPHTLSPA
jgi:hypothetical protein